VPRDAAVFLDDIVEACRKVASYTEGLTLNDFRGDTKTLDAVVRNLEVIGEAAKKVPGDVRSQIPGVDWQRMGGLRDILIHEYFAVDVEIVWDVVQSKTEDLRRRVEEFLSRPT